MLGRGKRFGRQRATPHCSSVPQQQQQGPEVAAHGESVAEARTTSADQRRQSQMCHSPLRRQSTTSQGSQDSARSATSGGLAEKYGRRKSLKTEQRHDAFPEYSAIPEVYPGLFLGSAKAAQDRSWLERTRITHILNATQVSQVKSFFEGERGACPPPLPLPLPRAHTVDRDERGGDEEGADAVTVTTGSKAADRSESEERKAGDARDMPSMESSEGRRFTYMRIGFDDLLDAKIELHFEKACDFLDVCAREKRRVLVHCRAGRSRSTSLIIAWAMRSRQMTLRAAYESVLAARPNIGPNIGFLMKLMELERHLLEREGKLAVNTIDFFDRRRRRAAKQQAEIMDTNAPVGPSRTGKKRKR
jgi:hypothetical protein